MALSIDWATKVITVPQADLTLVSGSIYELDVNQFRLDLKDIEDSEDGSVFPDTHRHNTEVTLSGTTYARTVEIINGYTVLFEDVGTPYTVKCVGANHNIGDVKVVNQVSLIIGNAAGLIVGGGGGGGYTPAQIADAVWDHASGLSVGVKLLLIEKILRNKTVTDPVAGTMTVYDNDGTTVLLTASLWENTGATIAYRGKGADRRERLA